MSRMTALCLMRKELNGHAQRHYFDPRHCSPFDVAQYATRHCARRVDDSSSSLGVSPERGSVDGGHWELRGAGGESHLRICRRLSLPPAHHCRTSSAQGFSSPPPGGEDAGGCLEGGRGTRSVNMTYRALCWGVTVLGYADQLVEIEL